VSTSTTEKAEGQIWGIYHTDREHARELGDPLRTTIEAPTKIAAEKAAAQLGFSEPWAHPIAPEVATLAQSVLKKYRSHRQEPARRSSHGIHI